MTLLKDQVAIVPGASRGLGLEISRQYLIEGANVVMCARDKSVLLTAHQSLVEEDPEFAGHTVVCASDVSEPDDVRGVLDVAVRKFGKIDILVNNAAILGPVGSFDTCDWTEWKRAIAVDLLGPALVCRLVLPYMQRQRKGKIIHLSGGGATGPRPDYTAYAVAKTGLVRFTEILALEMKPFNIQVNAIAPGVMDTRMIDEDGRRQMEKQGGDSRRQAASLAVFLASEKSNHVTGRLISAVWDKWQALPDQLGPDQFTLRRVVN